MALQLRTIVNSPVTSNCHILYDDYSKHCLIIDPGSENPEEILGVIAELYLCPDYIFLTHEHFDHIWSCAALVEKYSIPIACSRICSFDIQDRKKNLSVFYNQVGIVSPPARVILEEVDWILDWKGKQVCFYNSPGHSVGGVIFIIGKYLFTGDTLMKDIATPTKFCCSSKERLKETLAFIETLKGQHLLVCPGHGDTFELDDYDLRKAL